MGRAGPAAVIRAWLAAAAALLALAAPAQACTPRTSLTDVEGDVMCTVCGLPLDEATESPEAQSERALIARLVARCQSKPAIERRLVAEYGPAVLAAPPRKGFHWLAWLLPIAGLIVGTAILSALVWRWSRSRPPSEASVGSNGRLGLDPELERRLDRELARFDG
jgi:cytochrome c-type biogenesis protein CcmH